MTTPTPDNAPARRLGPFDATMIVMGGIIGAGIFKNPSVVAQSVHTPALLFLAWIAGGVFALIGAFVYAELAVLRPKVGGQYAYLREAYSPMIAFLYGWTLLLVTQTGGMAGAAIVFGDYFNKLSGLNVPPRETAALLLAALTVINCLGVRAGSNVQSGFMLAKIAAIVLLIGAGWIAVSPAAPSAEALAQAHAASGGWSGFADAMVPVIFAYGGWQTASFITGEMRNPKRDLPLGLFIGVAGVITLYLAVNIVCERALGMAGLASTTIPASSVMQSALGDKGARIIALGIAVSTAGFLSQSILTAPRVYYAMARDGVFFKAVGRLNPRSHAPEVAIALQGLWAALIAWFGAYKQINDYVVSIDVIFFGLTGAALLVFRARARSSGEAPEKSVRVPGHPFTTLLFIAGCWSLALITLIRAPKNAGIGFLILLAGAVVYPLWKLRRPTNSPLTETAPRP